MLWGTILIVTAVAAVVGVLLRRWWLLAVLGAIATAHVGWLVLTGQETTEDTTGMLVAIVVVYLYAPALAGVALGTWAGRRRVPPGSLRAR